MISPSTRHWALTLLPLSLGFVACSDEVAEPLPPALVQFADAPASECPDGGRLIVSGIDQNRDGTLEGDEIASSVAVCNGQTGEQGVPGTNALVRSTVEPDGANCDRGGIRIDVGGDDNADGVLDGDEIDQTTYACDGPQGQAGLRTLVETSTVGPPACEGVGVQLRYGLDANENDELDPNEVDSTDVLCEGGVGEESLVNVDEEPPGPNCPVGGLRLSSGLDANGDLVLDPSEIDDVEYVCDPVRALVRVETSTACANGGSVIESGGDLDQDGVLDANEVTETREVCSGEAGGRSLVVTTPEPVGANCAAGGQQVEVGFDDNEDGVLQPAEIDSTSYVCNGERGADGVGGNAVRVTVLPVGSTQCPNGGALVETGPDTNGNGNLDDVEVTNTTASCNGASSTTLVDVVDLAPGGTCTNGGQRIWIGVDANGNGLLDVAERASSTDVCDTTTGSGVPFAILTPSLPDSFRTLEYSATIEAFGGTAGGYTWQIIGTPPPGLTIDPTGTPSADLTGTLTAAGTFTFSIEVTDTFGNSAIRSYTVEISEPPCEPGLDGVIGTSLTTTSLPSDLDDGFGIAADTSTSGFVYIVDNSPAELWQLSKDGATSLDLTTLSSLSGLEVGYDIRFDGDDLYVLDDSSLSTSARIQRISTDGGQTFVYEDMATFPSTDNPDDFRGIAFDGDIIYVTTQGSSDTEIWSVDTSGTLPATAVLEANITAVDGCTGLDLDDDYFYTGCTFPQDQIVRIDRVTFAVETVTTDIDTSSTFNSARIQDTDADGLADVLWFGGFNDARYVCDPGGTLPAFSGAFGASEDAAYGLDIDYTNGIIYRFDDLPEELFSYQ